MGDLSTTSEWRAWTRAAHSRARSEGTSKTTTAATTMTPRAIRQIVMRPLRSSVFSDRSKLMSENSIKVKNRKICTTNPETPSIAPAVTAVGGSTPKRWKNLMFTATRAAVLGIARLM